MTQTAKNDWSTVLQLIFLLRTATREEREEMASVWRCVRERGHPTVMQKIDELLQMNLPESLRKTLVDWLRLPL